MCAFAQARPMPQRLSQIPIFTTRAQIRGRQSANMNRLQAMALNEEV